MVCIFKFKFTRWSFFINFISCIISSFLFISFLIISINAIFFYLALFYFIDLISVKKSWLAFTKWHKSWTGLEWLTVRILWSDERKFNLSFENIKDVHRSVDKWYVRYDSWRVWYFSINDGLLHSSFKILIVAERTVILFF